MAAIYDALEAGGPDAAQTALDQALQDRYVAGLALQDLDSLAFSWAEPCGPHPARRRRLLAVGGTVAQGRARLDWARIGADLGVSRRTVRRVGSGGPTLERRPAQPPHPTSHPSGRGRTVTRDAQAAAYARQGAASSAGGEPTCRKRGETLAPCAPAPGDGRSWPTRPACSAPTPTGAASPQRSCCPSGGPTVSARLGQVRPLLHR